MYRKEDLIRMIKEMGIKKDDTLLIHSSMKAVGEVEGGADTVLDAFMEYLEDGLLLLPTHTWASMSESHSYYDPAVEPACVGILPNLFLKRPGVIRSLHPTHSLAGFGKDAAIFLNGEENCKTPCPPEGCYNRLRDRKAKILLLGVNHVKNTFIHSVEEVLLVPERFTEEPVMFEIQMPDGVRKRQAVYRHYNKTTAHISEAYQKLGEAFYETGAAKNVRFGDACCILCDAESIFQTVSKVLSHSINCLMEMEKIPSEWWMDDAK
ncbi:MAG: AAC(3) family N-acetyltransferase [Lachnospiraceae bacterium]|nr:AAC(3) family N-acetyltransferase [Lachnospiraceae bacterium]